MSETNNDLLIIFREEVDSHLEQLNRMLAEVVASPSDDHSDTLREMNRLTHSIRGAARSVGYAAVEQLGELLEEICAGLREDSGSLSDDLAADFQTSFDALQELVASEDSTRTLDDFAPLVERLKAHIASHTAGTDDTQEMPAVVPETVNDVSAMPPADDTLIALFYDEASTYLEQLNDGLLQVEIIEGDERDGLLREMNRCAHSMKGAARAVGFGLVETISHYMEEVFGAMLAGDYELDPSDADTLYDGLDLIQLTLEGETHDSDVVASVIERLGKMAPDSTPPNSVKVPAKAPQTAPPPTQKATQPQTPKADQSADKKNATSTDATEILNQTTLIRPPEESLRVPVSRLDRLMAEASELLVTRMQGETRQQRMNTMRRNLSKWQREWRSVRASYIRLVRRLQEQAGDEVAAEMATVFRFLEANQRNLSETNREFAQLYQMSAQDNMQLAMVAEAIQSDIANLRMMPFETIIPGFQRVVRDLARDTGKQVELEISGNRVEIDKTVLDALKEPLMHCLRNAVDHGIEAPDDRVAAGKPPQGKVQLNVEQRGSEITLQVRDDGRGLAVDKIRKRAIERQLINEADAESLSDDEIRQLIFMSGFSTSDTVTPLSGRGLGMDIVRTRVESLRGRVSVTSDPGAGTTTTLTVPVSLTRIRAVVLQVGGENYAIPAVMVTRMETIKRDDIFTAGGQDTIVLNETPVPLLSLGTILGASAQTAESDYVQIIALTASDRTVAFEVDELFSEMELVLKPLGHELASTPFVGGAALLGSGEVIIVLDANDLVRRSTGISGGSTSRALTRQPAAARTLRVLVVDDSITTRTLEKNILEAVGFEVHVAIDGVEAWSRLMEIEPDVVISDVEMPNMNGLELARTIKESSHTAHLPVILLTSLGKPEQREAGLQAGADAYLVKSQFDQNELLETIQRVL